MSVELIVGAKPGQGLIESLISGPGSLAEWEDVIWKGAKPVANVNEFVSLAIQTFADKGKIDFIQINGHGSKPGFYIGRDWISEKTIEDFRERLAKVAPLLSPTSCVEVVACKAGHATELMRKFSHILGGVPIVGYLIDQGGGHPPVGQPVVVTPGSTHRPPKLAPGVSPPSAPPPGS
jgi:hypothetical protein